MQNNNRKKNLKTEEIIKIREVSRTMTQQIETLEKRREMLRNSMQQKTHS